jgi:hypothetical protein
VQAGIKIVVVIGFIDEAANFLRFGYLLAIKLRFCAENFLLSGKLDPWLKT